VRREAHSHFSLLLLQRPQAGFASSHLRLFALQLMHLEMVLVLLSVWHVEGGINPYRVLALFVPRLSRLLSSAI
jgi:hypothetical protein